MRVRKQTKRKSHKGEFGGGREHRFVTKKSIIKLVFGTLTTGLDLEREPHLHRSRFPFFGKLSSGCKSKKKKGLQLKTGIKQLRDSLLLILCSHWGCPRSREIQVVGPLELSEGIFFS